MTTSIENLELAFRLYDTISEDGIHININAILHNTDTDDVLIDTIGNPDSISYREVLHKMLDDFLNECAKERADN